MHSSYIRLVPGAKTAVLMVHGIVGTPRHFDFLLDTIPQAVSVMNILLPGHGGTVKDFANASMKQWKQTVAEAMETLCTTHERVIVVAHSMGTLLTAEAAQQWPQVKGFLFINVPLRVWVAPWLVPSAILWSFGIQRKNNETDRTLKLAASAQPDKLLWRYLAWIPRFWELLVLCRESIPRFEQLQVPSFAFQSHGDELVLRSTSRHLLKNDAICHTMLPDCGHFAYPEAAQEQMCRALAELISKFEE